MACKSEFFIAIFCLPIITTTLANANIMDLQHYGSKGKLFCSDSKRIKSPILIRTLKQLISEHTRLTISTQLSTLFAPIKSCLLHSSFENLKTVNEFLQRL